MPTKRARRKNRVLVQYGVPRRGVPGAAALRKWAASSRADVTLRIVGTREARFLNFHYRKKNYPANVLSFPYGNGSGDVVLCHPVISREARAQAKSLAAHYAHLVVHGVLHLRGFDHRKKRQAVRMERAETRILAGLGIADPYTVK